MYLYQWVSFMIWLSFLISIASVRYEFYYFISFLFTLRESRWYPIAFGMTPTASLLPRACGSTLQLRPRTPWTWGILDFRLIRVLKPRLSGSDHKELKLNVFYNHERWTGNTKSLNIDRKKHFRNNFLISYLNPDKSIFLIYWVICCQKNATCANYHRCRVSKSLSLPFEILLL